MLTAYKSEVKAMCFLYFLIELQKYLDLATHFGNQA